MKHIFSFIALSALVVLLAPQPGLAFGDGYTDCERDPVFERDFSAKATTGANLRERACMTDSKVIGMLSSGETARVIAETDGWYKVKTSAGKIAWVGARLMQKTGEDQSSGGQIENTKIKAEASSADETTVNRVKGYILLQVESAGEAWYVNPDDGGKYYMKDGETAFNMMRNFGLGVSNANFEKIKNGDRGLLARLKGRIIILPERNGEAYYIYPVNGAAHYLKNGTEAYKIMSKLGLGARNADLNKIRSKTKIEKAIAEKKESAAKDEEAASKVNSIVLTRQSGNSFAWEVDGYSASGYKLVWSLNENPAYPTRSGDKYAYYSSPDARTGEVAAFNGAGTYYVRVCEYLGGKCGTYSNQLTIELASAEEENEGSTAVNSITLSGSGKNISWTIDGYSEMGFKVVWSKDAHPTYPTRSGDKYNYYSEPEKRSDTLSAFDGAGDYYVRVCEYLGGKCGLYSNEIQVTL